jgi:hypothetical protein
MGSLTADWLKLELGSINDQVEAWPQGIKESFLSLGCGISERAGTVLPEEHEATHPQVDDRSCGQSPKESSPR